jgi:hypothetical protein
MAKFILNKKIKNLKQYFLKTKKQHKKMENIQENTQKTKIIPFEITLKYGDDFEFQAKGKFPQTEEKEKSKEEKEKEKEEKKSTFNTYITLFTAFLSQYMEPQAPENEDDNIDWKASFEGLAKHYEDLKDEYERLNSKLGGEAQPFS